MHFSLLPTPFSLVSRSHSVGRKVGGIPRGESKARHGRLRSWAVDTAYQRPSRNHASAPQGHECLAGWWCNWYKSKKKKRQESEKTKADRLIRIKHKHQLFLPLWIYNSKTTKTKSCFRLKQPWEQKWLQGVRRGTQNRRVAGHAFPHWVQKVGTLAGIRTLTLFKPLLVDQCFP